VEGIDQPRSTSRPADSMSRVASRPRTAWEAASQKHIHEYGDLLTQAASGSSLTGTERGLLREILRCSPEVVHLQSGHGLDDVALVQAGRAIRGRDRLQPGGRPRRAAPRGRSRVLDPGVLRSAAHRSPPMHSL